MENINVKCPNCNMTVGSCNPKAEIPTTGICPRCKMAVTYYPAEGKAKRSARVNGGSSGVTVYGGRRYGSIWE